MCEQEVVPIHCERSAGPRPVQASSISHVHKSQTKRSFCPLDVVLLSAAAAKNRVSNANWGPKRYQSHAPTADGSTADGTRESTGDPQKMGESSGTGEALGLA